MTEDRVRNGIALFYVIFDLRATERFGHANSRGE